MAKGRKLTTSRSERFLGTYAYAHTQSSTAADPSELQEEDMWSTADDPPGEWESYATAESNGGVVLRSQHPIRRDNHRHLGGLSMVFEDPASNATAAAPARIVHQFRAQQEGLPSPRGRQAASSAPVNVPDWSKILRVDSMESLHDAEEDDEDESEMVPPHEYLARSRKAAAKSVFEGMGRTLKGRDLSRVRDAVWSQTGFYG